MLTCGIVGFLTFLFGYIFATLKNSGMKALPAPDPINVIEGLVLPEPDDPRWYNNGQNHLILGKIKLNCSTNSLNFDDGGPWQSCQTDNPLVEKYKIAILMAFQARVAEDSILNAKMPPKEWKKKVLPVEEEAKQIKGVEFDPLEALKVLSSKIQELITI